MWIITKIKKLVQIFMFYMGGPGPVWIIVGRKWVLFQTVTWEVCNLKSGATTSNPRDDWRVDMNLRFWMICASLMSYRNISANRGLVPINFNLNWNVWKTSCKFLWIPFCGQGFANTRLIVFIQFPSFCLLIKSPDEVSNICREFSKGLCYQSCASGGWVDRKERW